MCEICTKKFRKRHQQTNKQTFTVSYMELFVPMSRHVFFLRAFPLLEEREDKLWQSVNNFLLFACSGFPIRGRG